MREMRAEALLATLEFPLAGVEPVVALANGRPLFVYAVGDLATGSVRRNPPVNRRRARRR